MVKSQESSKKNQDLRAKNRDLIYSRFKIFNFINRNGLFYAEFSRNKPVFYGFGMRL